MVVIIENTGSFLQSGHGGLGWQGSWGRSAPLIVDPAVGVVYTRGSSDGRGSGPSRSDPMAQVAYTWGSSSGRMDRRCGPGPRVHGAPITQGWRVTRSGPSISRSAAEVLHKRRDGGVWRRTAVLHRSLAGDDPKWPLGQGFKHGRTLRGAGD
jgi:hypothetical protein